MSRKILSESDPNKSLGEPILSPAERQMLQQQGYHVDTLLALGCFSRVYRGSFPASDQEVPLAIKMVDTRSPLRFLHRELDILRAIRHPHIVALHNIFKDADRCFIVTKLAEEGDLLDFLMHKGSVKETVARVWAGQLAQAINYLHERNIVHRDIKCENILVTKKMDVQLADFGFARFLHTEDELSQGFSETYCGSLSYVAPEVLCRQPYRAKPADLWSLGVVIFVMLNAELPFKATRFREIHRQQLKCDFKFRRHLQPRLSRSAKHLVRHLLQPNVTRRFTAQQVLRYKWMKLQEEKNSPLND